MSLREILLWPDERLKQPCETVADVAEVEQLVTDLFETMYDAPGRGLAAPQVGVLKRVFVMDAGWKEGDMVPLACINPEIVEVSEETASGPEGCLSIPGVTAQVRRPVRVRMAFTDLSGTRQERDFEGSEAIVAQHEYDHLEGLVHFDRLDPQEAKALKLEYEAQQS
ncbi:peptide deformylase [Citreicella sp. SE45]|uniref:peptide deformylase n=1 Tax=Salipiger TaxID=263377 RepID=UPI0001B8C61A|nr:peptide deformylase [Citreicella sp. SE45]MBN8188983.1 peptide deformylase [Salipiger thiooxidans]MBR9839119.1 peptide deformylase [Paracoccaceae bacterium]NIY97976.1 peptide deformylase [Salipiger sp. HF18]NVK61325.1 peptide deformylase [Paracoccaceae bacterium]